MHDPFFVMMVGLPCSGKTTWREEFVKDQVKIPVVVSCDDYIEKIAKEQGTTYDAIWSETIKEAEQYVLTRVHHAVEKRLSFIWDQTNLTCKVRAKRLKLIPDDYWKICSFHNTPDNEELARRLASRPGKHIPNNVIERMKTQLEIPSTEEGFNVIYERGVRVV